MSLTIVFDDDLVGSFIASRAGCRYEPGVDTSIGTLDAHGVPQGGFIYSGDTGRSVSMHMAGIGSRWCTRDLLWAAFDFPFNQLGLAKVFAMVAASNTPSLACCLRAGFKVETVLQDVFVDGPAFVLGMYRQDCRWLARKPLRIGRRFSLPGAPA